MICHPSLSILIYIKLQTEPTSEPIDPGPQRRDFADDDSGVQERLEKEWELKGVRES